MKSDTKGYKQTEIGVIPEDWEVKQLIDLAELIDMNPVNISDYEKQMTKVFLDTLLVDLDTKMIIDITTTPHELACFFLTAIRSMSKQLEISN